MTKDKTLEKMFGGKTLVNTVAGAQASQMIVRGKEWLNLYVTARDSGLILGKVKDFLYQREYLERFSQGAED